MRIKLDIKIEEPDPSAIYNKLKRVLWKSINKMHDLAVNYAPADTGRLKQSIAFYPYWQGETEYILTDGVDYGIHVEFGTAPHHVPITPLKDWARRVLGDESLAYAVEKKISRQGTAAQPFFRPALEQVKLYWTPTFYEQVMAQPE